MNHIYICTWTLYVLLLRIHTQKYGQTYKQQIEQITQLEKTTKDTHILLKQRVSVPKNSDTSSNVYTHIQT